MSEPRAGRNAVRPGISLGSIGGVPVVLAWSWFAITGLIVVLFGPTIRESFPRIGAASYAVALGYALLLAVSVLVHELAHALTARAFGWPITRIVLNLWGGHTQFASFNSSPGRSLLVALAGPAANFGIAGLGWLLLQLLTPGSISSTLVFVMVWANLLLAVFNALPGLPLDGGRLVESLVWRATGSQDRGTVAAGWAGRIIVILLLGGVVGVPLVQGRGPDVVLIVLAVVMGAFLWMGATAAIENARMRLRLPAISAGRLQQPAVGLPADTTVQTARRLLREHPGAAIVLTGSTGRPEAVVDEGAMLAVPEDATPSTPVRATARRLAAGAYVPEHAEGQELVQFLARLEGSEYAVVSKQGTVTGLLHQRTVVQAITGRNAP